MTCIALCLGCNELDVTANHIIGEWADNYAAYPDFAQEGGVSYTFKADGVVDIHHYDVFAGSRDITTVYSVGRTGKNIIFIEYPDVDDEYKSYKIVKLTNDEMEWQRVGTTFSLGTVGSDFKHFVRCSK